MNVELDKQFWDELNTCLKNNKIDALYLSTQEFEATRPFVDAVTSQAHQVLKGQVSTSLQGPQSTQKTEIRSTPAICKRSGTANTVLQISRVKQLVDYSASTRFDAKQKYDFDQSGTVLVYQYQYAFQFDGTRSISADKQSIHEATCDDLAELLAVFKGVPCEPRELFGEASRAIIPSGFISTAPLVSALEKLTDPNTSVNTILPDFWAHLRSKIGEVTDPRDMLEAAVSTIRDLKAGCVRDDTFRAGEIIASRLVGRPDTTYSTLLYLAVPKLVQRCFGEDFKNRLTACIVEDLKNERDMFARFDQVEINHPNALKR